RLASAAPGAGDARLRRAPGWRPLRDDQRRTRPDDVGGTVTAGPFVRATKQGTRLGVIVDHSRLVWIDPAKAAPSWSWPSVKGEPIVGLPVLDGDHVVVADQSGAYKALDEATGKEAGKGHRLSGSISPA